MRFGKLALACLGVLTLTCLGSVSRSDVLTFEDLSGNGTLGTYHGFTFDSPWNYYSSPQFPYTPHSGVERIYNNSSPATSYINFNSDISFDGAWFAGQPTAVASYNLYDASNTLLSTSGPLTLSSTPTYLASGYSGNNVRKFQFTGTNSFFVLDDLTYHVAAVPEPGTLALLASFGLTGAAFLARRRKQAHKAA